jgi:hypothetical protein
MSQGRLKGYPPRQTELVKDRTPLSDLTHARNDADDRSDAGCPTTDHEARGWRATPPAKP